jgi:hypothetical protein
MSTERRHNWKANLGKAALVRHHKRIALLVQLDAIREEIRRTGLNFLKHDQLHAQMRETIAQLATL